MVLPKQRKSTLTTVHSAQKHSSDSVHGSTARFEGFSFGHQIRNALDDLLAVADVCDLIVITQHGTGELEERLSSNAAPNKLVFVFRQAQRRHKSTNVLCGP